MTRNQRVLLGVRRFRQHASECAIAAAASMANYYDRSIEYKDVRKLVRRTPNFRGLYTSQQAKLLNSLGFSSVTVVTADLGMVDFSWSTMPKDGLVSKLREMNAYYGKAKKPYYRNYKRHLADMATWLSDERYDNRLIIDYDFGKYIRAALKKGNPVGVSVVWTSLFRFSKSHPLTGSLDDIRGDTVDHALVIRGYDSNGVYVVDSYQYNGNLKKYKNGYYKLSWERLLVNIPAGDIILVKA